MALIPRLYSAIRLDPDTEEVMPVGDVEIDADGRLRVLSSEPGLLGYLNDIADDLNARDEITEKVPGELRNALEARYVPRDAPDFLDVLKEYVSKYYGLELRSSADMQEEKADFVDL
ncbi:MAG: hypothetical protein H6739_35255 [Alphaproteobacteria bacterium]|nr:hypothetical protein [Alphaproteobacteria bacterium]